MHYEYEFDYGASPSFVIDGWFLRSIRPVFLISIILFPLAAFSPFWFTRYLIPAIAFGALAIYFGVFLYRRHMARRRVAAMENAVFHYVIDDDGIHYDNEIGSGILRWGFRGKLVRSRGFILLQSNEIGLLPVPADAPNEVLDFVRQRLASR